MNRGEIWRISIDLNAAGGVKSGRAPEDENSRLVVVISSDALAVLPLRIVIPLTSWKPDFASAPWLVRVPPVLNSGLEQVMAADALQVRSISTGRLKHRLGSLPDKLVTEIVQAVMAVIQT